MPAVFLQRLQPNRKDAVICLDVKNWVLGPVSSHKAVIGMPLLGSWSLRNHEHGPAHHVSGISNPDLRLHGKRPVWVAWMEGQVAKI